MVYDKEWLDERTLRRVRAGFVKGLRGFVDPDIIEFVRGVPTPRSPKGEYYDPDATPWWIPFLRRIPDRNVVSHILLGSGQGAGKSAGARAALMYTIKYRAQGNIFYWYENDDKAAHMWREGMRDVLMGFPPVADIWPNRKGDSVTGFVKFPHLNLTVQGADNPSNQHSTTAQVGFYDEAHAYHPGGLAGAMSRTKGYGDEALQIILSTAGDEGGELHGKWLSSTRREWLTPCPFCGHFQAMHDDVVQGKRGGIRYDAENCRNDDGTYNYEQLAKTLYYECEKNGCRIPDDKELRKQMMAAGKESDPAPGSDLSHEGTRVEAASIPALSFLGLVKAKHEALRVMKYGDIVPFLKYLRESSVRFTNPNFRPSSGKRVSVTKGLRIGDGLGERAIKRFMGVDYQKGWLHKGEGKHMVIVIMDVSADLEFSVVWAGKAVTWKEVEERRAEFGVAPMWVGVDSGWGTTALEVYEACAVNGWVALKGSEARSFAHDHEGERVTKLYSPMQYAQAGSHGLSTFPVEGAQNADFYHYSKDGLRDLFFAIKEAAKLLIPENVEMEFLDHLESEEPVTGTDKKGQPRMFYKKRAANDYLVCCLYCMLLAQIAGIFNGTASIIASDTTPIEADSEDSPAEDAP